LATLREQVGAPESLAVPFSSSRGKLLAQKQELGDATLDSLLADLTREEFSTGQKKDHTPLYRKIKALLFVHPECSPRWGALLCRAAPHSLTMRLVPAALGAVGHEQAQAALVAALKAHGNDEVVALRLLAILAMVKSPSPLAEDAVRQRAFRSPLPAIAASAQLGLGIMARSLATTQTNRVAPIVTWAVRELQSSVSPTRKRHFLLVVGNTGALQTLPAIRAVLADRDSTVRA